MLNYVNEINNRIVFKIKSGYKLELSSKETMKLLGSSSDAIDGDKNSELVPKLESVDLVLIHCNVVIIINKRLKYYLCLYQIKSMLN